MTKDHIRRKNLRVTKFQIVINLKNCHTSAVQCGKTIENVITISCKIPHFSKMCEKEKIRKSEFWKNLVVNSRDNNGKRGCYIVEK